MALHAHNTVDDNLKPNPDTELTTIATYTSNYIVSSALAYDTARYCLMDSIGCAILALQYPACTKLLGPIIPDTVVPNGARILGTSYKLDPILAAFNVGTMVRWLDYNDTWLAAEWGHPSDNLGAILAITDYISRKNIQENKKPYTIRDVLTAMIKAHEIQGVLALENGFNRLGYDHVLLVKIASTAVATQLLGGNVDDITNALSQAWLDGAALRTYRHAPNTGSRKSWAAGDATSRATRLAWMTLQGEMGYPGALAAKKWGFYDTVMDGKHLIFGRELGSYVMENVLFKISYPAEFHAQTAVECAIKLHNDIKNKVDQIDKIVLHTQESAVRIISKSGPLHNPADRDHCLQYMVAIGLLHGELDANHYENKAALDPTIDLLRSKMVVQENIQYSKDYLDSGKRSIANAIQVFFNDGTSTDKVIVEYPVGHRKRRDEGIPLLINKFKHNMSTHYNLDVINQLLALFADTKKLEAMPVHEFIDLLVM